MVYIYQKLLQENSALIDKIKGVILLSLVDIPGLVKKGTTNEFLKFAEEREKKVN